MNNGACNEYKKAMRKVASANQYAPFDSLMEHRKKMRKLSSGFISGNFGMSLKKK